MGCVVPPFFFQFLLWISFFSPLYLFAFSGLFMSLYLLFQEVQFFSFGDFELRNLRSSFYMLNLGQNGSPGI